MNVNAAAALLLRHLRRSTRYVELSELAFYRGVRIAYRVGPALLILGCSTNVPPCRLHVPVAGERFACPAGQAEVQSIDGTSLCCPLTREGAAR